MLKIELDKWNQDIDDLRRRTTHEQHPRTRERFLLLLIVAEQGLSPTQAAHALGRRNTTGMEWVKRYNEHGPDALVYRRSGGRHPLFQKK